MIDIAYVMAGALTGFVVGLTGVGGGALMTPILLLFFGVAPTTAVATDLWFAALTKIIAARIHHSSGQIDWKVVKCLWRGSLPTALLLVIAVSVGGQLYKPHWLKLAIGVVVFITAVGLLSAPTLMQMARTRRLSEPARYKAMQPTATVIAGIILAVCVTLTSVGAGALGTVMLLYLYPLRMTPHRLVATDIAHAIPLAIIAGTGYLLAGLVDWSMLASLLVGSIPAVAIGCFAGKRFSPRWIQISLAAVLLMVAVRTVT